MNYKELLITINILFLLCSSTDSLLAQEKNASDLITLIEDYDGLKDNTEKDKVLIKVEGLVQNISKDSIDYILKNYDANFIAMFAKADYDRLEKNYELAKNEYHLLEQEILKKQPVDYILLAHTIWSSSNNFSLKNFSFKNGLKELYKGLDYAKLSEVDRITLSYHSNLRFYHDMSANYQQAAYHNNKLYDIAKKTNDSLYIITALSKIMEDFNATDNGESAIKVWRKIWPIFIKKQSEHKSRSRLYENLTIAYIRVKQLDSAMHYNKLSFQIDSIEGNHYRDSQNKYYKGKILVGLKRIDEAKKLFLSSYKVASERPHKTIQAISCIELAQIYLEENQPSKALELLKSTYTNTNHLRNIHKSQLELWLSKAYEVNQNLDSALFYRSKADKSIQIEKRDLAKRQVALAMVELDIDNYIDENEELTQSNEALNKKISKSTKTKKIIIYTFFIIIILISLFLYQRNQKAKLRISQHKEELSNKERIAIEAELNTIRSQMNPHFMFNSLNSINEFIQNDSSEDASNYLVKFSRLMRSTLNYSKRKFVTLGEEIDLLKLYVQLENLRFYNSIDFSLTIDQTIDSNKVLIPPMMIQPFVENAIWHGLMAKEKNRKLSLSFSETKQNIICNIEDNGIGRTASAEQKTHRPKHKSQGIGLTQRRLELLKNIHGKEAGIEVVDLKDSEKAIGTLVKVILPKQIDV